MGSATAYMCDGPACSVLVHRAPGTQYPSAWMRVSVRLPGESAPTTGAFHSPECATAWVAERTKAEEPDPELPLDG